MATREHALFRRIDHPGYHHAGALCYITGQTGPGVDLGIEIEGEGALFLTLNTIREIAEVAGFSVNAEGESLEMENAHLQHELALAAQKIAEQEEELAAVAKVIARAAAVPAVAAPEAEQW